MLGLTASANYSLELDAASRRALARHTPPTLPAAADAGR